MTSSSTYDEQQSYITHVRSMISKKLKSKIPREFLEQFLSKIEPSNEEFPISLEEIAPWLGYEKGNLRRLITEDYARQSTFYKEGEDYIKGEGRSNKNRKTVDIFMTIDCFEDLCCRLDSPKGEQVRQYFILVEKAYKEYYNRAYNKRIEEEDSDITKEKEYNENVGEFEYGPSVYFDQIDQINPVTKAKVQVLKVGETKQMPIRFPQLINEYPGNHKLMLVHPSKSSKTIEKCILENSEPWIVPCDKAPCPKEIMYREDYPAMEIFEICKKKSESAREEIQDLIKNKKKPDKTQPCHFYFKRKGKIRNLGVD